ncbi:MAG: hypothetical protein GTN76_16205 [Candidatus Aenigmarchaeota archaeon]|nr:hypothetical protein [Candidatus Aenigmarchaeota archaeon]
MNFRFVFALLLTFFLILPGSFALTPIEETLIKDPARVDELRVNVFEYGTITSDGEPTGITINLTIPQDDERQDVSIGVNTYTNELGSEVAFIKDENPDNVFNYNFSGYVRSRANHQISLPKSYVIPNEAKIYLQPTENIQSDDPRIRDIAEGLVKDSKDDFEKVAKLASWVYDYLDYDISYSGRNIDALSVLDTKKGVCAEYTTLFIALARSVGIPSKYVSAFAYGQKGWERHAYSEVYLGEWVPVDPLWLEVGYIDATHIKFGDHVDNQVKNNVQIKGYDIDKIQWNVDETDIFVDSYLLIEKEEDYEMSISSENFRKGDDGVVIMKFTPKEYKVLRVSLEPCAGDYEVVSVEDKGKKIILRPYEEKTISWNFHVNGDLPRNLIFTCPLTLNSRSLALRTINVVVNTQYSERKKGLINARLGSSVLQLGAEQKVYVEVSGIQQETRIGIVAGSEYEEWALKNDGEITFSFTPKSLGEQSVIVYSSGEVVTLDYRVESDLKVFLENFTVPDYLKIGEKRNITAYIVNQGLGEKNLRLTLTVDGKEHIASLVVENKYLISLPVSFSSPGIKEVKIELKDTDVDLSSTRTIEAYEEPKIYYTAEIKEEKAFLKLDVQKSKIKNVNIKVADQEKQAGEIFGENEFEFTLAPGEYPIEITCKGLGNENYKVSSLVEFREKNFFEIIMDSINGFIEQIMGFFSS